MHFLRLQRLLLHMDLVQLHVCAQSHQLSGLHRHHHGAAGQFHASHTLRLRRVQNEHLLAPTPHRLSVLPLVDNSREERVLEGNELGGNQHRLFLALLFLRVRGLGQYNKDLVQIPLHDRLSLSDVPQSERAISTSRNDAVVDSDHGADVLLVSNTDRLDVEGLREVADEHLLVAIAGCQIISRVDLFASPFPTSYQSSNHSGAMADKERFLHEFREVERHNIANLIANDQVLRLLEETRLHRRALLFQLATCEAIEK